MLPQRRLILLAPLLAAFLGCANDEVFQANTPPEITQVTPSDKKPREIFTGNVTIFTLRARDAEKDPLTYYFNLEGNRVQNGASYEFRSDRPETVRVTGVVTDGKDETRVVWTVHVLEKDNRPPTIVFFSPTIDNPTIVLGDRILFQIKGNDLDLDSLRYSFAVDGVVVTPTSTLDFQGTEVGAFRVVGAVSDGRDAAQWGWNLRVVAEPDTSPPAAVLAVTAVSGSQPGEIDLSWTSSGDDGMVGTASEIQVKTAKVPILTEAEWAIADHKLGEPDPLPGGMFQSMTVSALNPGQDIYVAIRYIDDFFNMSPLGTSPMVKVRGYHVGGWVRDADTFEPIAGAVVRLTSVFEIATDASGHYEFQNLPLFWGAVDVRDELEPGVLGAYYDYRGSLFIDRNMLLDYVLVRDLPGDWFPWEDYYDYLKKITGITDRTPGYLRHFKRWEPPIEIYLGGFVRNGVDYDVQIASAIDEWETLTGMDLFRVVSAPPEVGVVVKINAAGGDQFLVLTVDAEGNPVTGQVELRSTWSVPFLPNMRKVLLHELGHVLGLFHSSLSRHIMFSAQPLPSNPAPEEIKAVRDLFHIPRNTPVSYYLYD